MSRITIDFTKSKGTINPNLYGHFSEHIGGVFYDGLWVGEDSPVENVRGFRKALVDSFRKLEPPVLRWPGGCFAETYDWRDGIGPRANRPRRVNWWYPNDGRVETNQVGTHEFMDFCRMVGAEPYFAANMTTVAPLHIRNWMEYCNFPAGLTTLADERAANGSPEPFGVRYWGIGNENWGGGGEMTPELCADEYIRFTTSCYSVCKDAKFIICGPSGDDTEWTRRLLRQYASRKYHTVPTYGMSMHYYTAGNHGDDPFLFDENGWYEELFCADRIGAIMDSQRAVMDEFDPDRAIKLIVDEWGCWHNGGSGPSKGCNLFEQQSSMRDAAVAALTLNHFNNRCDFVDMANVAQLCNNLHSLYLAGGEHFVETPNYHVFALYKGHKGGKQLAVFVDSDLLEHDGYAPMSDLSASASVKDGVLTLTLANLNLTKAQNVSLAAIGGALTGKATLEILASEDPNACNTFEDPFAVTPKQTALTLSEDSVLAIPAAAVACLTLNL